MYINKMNSIDSYEVRDWGTNIMFIRKGVPTGGMWPPESDEFLIQWEAIQNELS
jgi:hypothetical protein